MTSEDGLRIGVDPASMRVVENDALPSGTAVFVTPDGMISQLFPPTAKTRAFPSLADIKPVTFETKLDTRQFAESLRLLGRGMGKAAQALRALRVKSWHVPEIRRPCSPGPADAATRRMYTAQRHVHRRALRRRRRLPAPRFGMYERFMETYAPGVITRQRPDGSLEAQLMAYQPKG